MGTGKRKQKQRFVDDVASQYYEEESKTLEQAKKRKIARRKASNSA